MAQISPADQIVCRFDLRLSIFNSSPTDYRFHLLIRKTCRTQAVRALAGVGVARLAGELFTVHSLFSSGIPLFVEMGASSRVITAVKSAANFAIATKSRVLALFAGQGKEAAKP